jgi:hypothetical protein
MVWKKNSPGERPSKKEAATKPLASLLRSPRGKCGSVRALKPSKQRLPPTDCCPTHATIWAMLMGEPLLPHCDMMSGLLVGTSVWGVGVGEGGVEQAGVERWGGVIE